MTEELNDYRELSIDEILGIFKYEYSFRIYHSSYDFYLYNKSYSNFKLLESTLKIEKNIVEYSDIYLPTTIYFNEEHKVFYTQENYDKVLFMLGFKKRGKMITRIK